MIDKIFSFGATINLDIVLPIFIGVLILIAIIYNLIKKKIQSKWIRKKVIIIGPKIIKDHFDSTIFVILASEDGTENGFIYQSEELRSQKDDSWLTGTLNGSETEVLIHPNDPQKYYLVIDKLPPSQYT